MKKKIVLFVYSFAAIFSTSRLREQAIFTIMSLLEASTAGPSRRSSQQPHSGRF